MYTVHALLGLFILGNGRSFDTTEPALVHSDTIAPM